MCSVIELQKPVRPVTGGVPAGTPFVYTEVNDVVFHSPSPFQKNIFKKIKNFFHTLVIFCHNSIERENVA